MHVYVAAPQREFLLQYMYVREKKTDDLSCGNDPELPACICTQVLWESTCRPFRIRIALTTEQHQLRSVD